MLRGQVNTLRFYLEGGEKSVEDVMQKNDLQMRACLAAGRRRDGRVERMNIAVQLLCLFIPHPVSEDFMRAVKGL